MMPPVGFAAPAAPASVQLSDARLQRLHTGARWARFLSIVGFIGSALMCLGGIILAVALSSTGGNLPMGGSFALILGMLLFVVVVSIMASVLLHRYAKNVRAFLDRGEPALLRAFQSLRRLWTLWIVTSILGALSAAYMILQHFGPSVGP
jgi:hypothetical protein